MKITDFVFASNGDSRSVAWAGFVLRVALGTMWFAIHVLLAPYSTGVRQELIELGNRFR